MVKKEIRSDIIVPNKLAQFRHNPRKAPFAWVGGKSLLADKIIADFPQHHTYVEVFGGALNVLYRKERSKVEIVNDIYGELINLHLAIKRRPEALSFYLHELLVSREIFSRVRTGRLKPRNDIERAALYYYRIALSFGAKGEHFAMSKHRAPRSIYRSFKAWSNRLKAVSIENMDFERLIAQYDSERTLFYLDPPYWGTESYYEGSKGGGFTVLEHERLANALKRAKGRFVLSYNDCEAVRRLYREYHIKTLETTYALCGRKRTQAKELLISN